MNVNEHKGPENNVFQAAARESTNGVPFDQVASAFVRGLRTPFGYEIDDVAFTALREEPVCKVNVTSCAPDPASAPVRQWDGTLAWRNVEMVVPGEISRAKRMPHSPPLEVGKLRDLVGARCYRSRVDNSCGTAHLTHVNRIRRCSAIDCQFLSGGFPANDVGSPTPAQPCDANCLRQRSVQD
jgi:hypothetical protein